MAPPAEGAAVYSASYGSGNLGNHGGPVISNAGFWALYWNSSVATSTQTSLGYTTLAEQMHAFLNSFGNDTAYSSTIATDDFSVVQQYGAISSTVRNYGYYVASERAKSSISDSGIRNFIAGVLNSGQVNVDTSIIYGVYMPAGMKVTMTGGASCSTFCGYHGHFNYGGLDIRYAVFPYLNCSACKLSNLSVADMITIVASHEIREAVTDPQLNAWYDDQGYEADDKCAWHNLYRMAEGGFMVQPEYSNGGGTAPGGGSYPGPGCIVPNQQP
ncbi:MAG TPA: hypothetical protein VFU28_22990 [Vicinamibacterales bacterium]|nr:hypothetical protein [Vicinamibacterales bacterium]